MTYWISQIFYETMNNSVIISILLVFLAIGCSNPDEKKNAYLQKGMEYQEKNDTNAAILEFKNYVQVDPKFADARYQLTAISQIGCCV